ncbi:zinc finger domain-containing protein [Rhodococcoides fascians]|uniref:zinc finger domain-containing protein n=1 Tax=Rhodococcoides fascians TaxID=1828 RepID=UPI00050D01A2|nr:hypothetical protein [Rhodococcus fascians]
MEQPGFDWLQQRDLALTIPCRYCKAAKGSPCVNKGRDGQMHEMVNLPAHFCRLNRAERLQRMAEADAEAQAHWEGRASETITDGFDGMRSTMVDPI